MKYRATYRRQGETIRTRWLPGVIEAQERLMARGEVGSFAYLGRVAGDVFEGGSCTAAPRNGGLVTIETKD